jgi:hypothetical protein
MPEEPSLEEQRALYRLVKEMFGGRYIKLEDYRGVRKSRRGQRHVLRTRPETKGFSALADDVPCATRRTGVMGGKPHCLYR